MRNKRLHRKDACNCFGNNEFFRCLSKNDFRIHYRNTPEAATALAALLPDPDAAFATGQIFKCGSRTHGGSVVLGGRNYYLKRYNDRGVWYRLRHLFKRSRALRTWQTGRDFFAAQVPVPEPLICLEERQRLLLRRGYILMQLVGDAERLDKLWPRLGPDQKTKLLGILAEVLGKMHKSGRTHGDLKWSNILVRQCGETMSVTLVDLDSCSAATWRAQNLARKDINLFLHWLGRCDDDRRLPAFFLDAWQRWVS